MEELEIGRREFLRYGIGLAIVTACAGILPGCRDMLEKIEEDKKKHAADTPLGVLVRKGHPVATVAKSDWRTRQQTTFSGTMVTTIGGTTVATYDFVDEHGYYADPKLDAATQSLGAWKRLVWYDLNNQPVLTLTP